MIVLQYGGEIEWGNTKGILLKAVFSQNYGVQGTGDPLDMAPSQKPGDGGVTDPGLGYNLQVAEPPLATGPFSENIGGYYVQVNPAANPTLQLPAYLKVFAPGGAELASNAAYPAAIVNGSVTLLVILAPQ